MTAPRPMAKRPSTGAPSPTSVTTTEWRFCCRCGAPCPGSRRRSPRRTVERMSRHRRPRLPAACPDRRPKKGAVMASSAELPSEACWRTRRRSRRSPADSPGAHALPDELVEQVTRHPPDVPTTLVEALDSDGRDTLTRLIDEMRRALDEGDDEMPDEVVMFVRDQVATRARSTAAWVLTERDARPAASSTPTPAAPESPSAGPDRGSRP